MTQSTVQEFLSALSAPALICTPDGAIVSLNSAASQWLESPGETAATRPLSEFLHAPQESIDGFLERCEKFGHAMCNGYVYCTSERPRGVAMTCHAQQISGSSLTDGLLLAFVGAPPVGIRVPARRHDTVPSAHDNRTVASPGIAGHSRPTAANDPGMMKGLNETALGLVHEANQPLTAIATYASSCRRWLSSGQTDHPKLIPTLDKIIEQVHATGQMIRSLKHAVRDGDDIGRVCDLNHLLSDTLELFALDPRLERCAVESHLSSDACPVLINAVQIQLVVLNLLRNALEASLAVEDREPRVRVSVVADENWAFATVSDSGAGVTREKLEQLFEPVVSRKENGLGLGLTICRRLARAHGGSIDFSPAAPQGASFQLRLPLTR